MIHGLDHYNLRAPRLLLEQLRQFYSEVVGLVVGERPPFSSFGYWLYAADKALLHLTECSAAEERVVGVATTFDHVAFSCSGRAQVERKLMDYGIKYEVAHVPRTGQVQLFFADPAGNGVELNFSDANA
jgi:catechol-2,3-dioxygenase